jgi:hypothetical protein
MSEHWIYNITTKEQIEKITGDQWSLTISENGNGPVKIVNRDNTDLKITIINATGPRSVRITVERHGEEASGFTFDEIDSRSWAYATSVSEIDENEITEVLEFYINKHGN